MRGLSSCKATILNALKTLISVLDRGIELTDRLLALLRFKFAKTKIKMYIIFVFCLAGIFNGFVGDPKTTGPGFDDQKLKILTFLGTYFPKLNIDKIEGTISRNKTACELYHSDPQKVTL